MTFATVNNIQIHYTSSGKSDGEVLLFVHGLGSSGRDWELQVSAFEADYHVLTVDMRGHGQSDKPAVHAYTMKQFAGDIIELLNQLEIDKVHIVGISMGGMIAFQMAVDYQERIKSMIIINSGPALVPKTFKDRMTIWMRFLIVRFMGMQKMGETLAPRLFVDEDQEDIRQAFIQRWSENDPNAYMAAMRALAGWTVEEHIHKITVPTLILASDQDYTPVAAKEAYVAKMSSAHLEIIENAHHAVSMERPQALNASIRQFLEKQ